MESYDEIVGFDYTSENEWRKWIEEKFLPLHKQLFIILKLREYLENLLKTNFKEAFSQQPIKEILLGGITKEGEYDSNSLAKFYKDVLGVSINPKEWVAYCRAGLDPVENDIKCKFEDTAFLTFVNEIKELIEKIFYKVGIEPQVIEDKEIEEIVNFPEKLLEVIRELYKSIVSISANYDYHMFIILNTRCIPRFFIEKAYPKLKENFKKVVEILELEEKFIPNISNEKIVKEYTLIGHKENGLTDILFNIQQKIWQYFNFSKGSFWSGEKWIHLKEIGEIFSFVTTPTDLLKEFREKIRKIIKTLLEIKLGTTEVHITGYNSTLYFVIKGALVIRVFNGYSPRTTYAFYKKDISETFVEFIERISPYIFIGMFSIRPVEKVPYPEVLSGVGDIDTILEFCNLEG